MAQSGQAGLLKTLLRAQGRDADKPARMAQPQPLSPARAAANAVGRAAERLYRMPVLPVDIKPGLATLAELPELTELGECKLFACGIWAWTTGRSELGLRCLTTRRRWRDRGRWSRRLRGRDGRRR